MVSHPETGSDSPIGSDRDRGRNKRSPKTDRERSPTRRGNVRDRRGPPQTELQQRYSPQ